MGRLRYGKEERKKPLTMGTTYSSLNKGKVKVKVHEKPRENLVVFFLFPLTDEDYYYLSFITGSSFLNAAQMPMRMMMLGNRKWSTNNVYGYIASTYVRIFDCLLGAGNRSL